MKNIFGSIMTMSISNTRRKYSVACRRDALVAVLIVLLPAAVLLVSSALAYGRRAQASSGN